MHASRKFEEIVDASASKRHQKIWWIQKVRRENFCALFIVLGTLLFDCYDSKRLAGSRWVGCG